MILKKNSKDAIAILWKQCYRYDISDFDSQICIEITKIKSADKIDTNKAS